MTRMLFITTSLAMLTIASAVSARDRDHDFNDRYYRHEIKEHGRGHGHGHGHSRNCDHDNSHNRGGYYRESYSTWAPSYTHTYNNYVEPAYYPPVYNVYPQPRTVYHYPVQQRPNVVFQLGF